MRTEVVNDVVYFPDYVWESFSAPYTLQRKNNEWFYVSTYPISLLQAAALAGRCIEEELLIMALTYGP